MNLSFQHIDGNNYFEITASGDLKTDDLMNAIDLVFAEAKQRNLSRVLFDMSGLIGDLPAADRFQLALQAARVLEHEIKLGVILNPQARINKLFEHVAVNRGADVAVFTVRGEALKWISGIS